MKKKRSVSKSAWLGLRVLFCLLLFSVATLLALGAFGAAPQLDGNKEKAANSSGWFSRFVSAFGVHLESAEPSNRSEEHTSELQSRFGISYAVFCLKKK